MLSPIHNQTGDTIVEVVIAVLVVSTIIAGAFTLTNHSTNTVRDSEEHAEALQLLQGQVELLRHAASLGTASLPATLTTPFCLTAASFYLTSDPNCTVGVPKYQLAITSPSATPNVGSTTTFDLTATWPTVTGETGVVYLAYKVAVAP